MHLILAVPRLFAAPQPRVASRALARIAASSMPVRDTRGIERALIDASGAEGVSVARAVALARGGVAPARAGGGDAATWLLADPVSLSLGIDDVRVAARVDDIDAAESAALQHTLNAHFAEDGVVLAGQGARWLARLAAPLAVEAPATSVVLGDSLWNRRPQGPDARRLERFANEAQMLLHEHPVNHARAARGQPRVDGLWLWGAEASAHAIATPQRPVDAFAQHGELGDIARGLARVTGGRCADLPPRFDALWTGDPASSDTRSDVAIAVAPAAPFDALERDWLAPALEALWRSARRRPATPASPTLSRLTLIGDDAHGAAHVFDALRPPLARRIAVYFTPPRFAWPS